MPNAFRVSLSDVAKEMGFVTRDQIRPVARAVTTAIRRAGTNMKTRGVDEIGAALGSRFSHSWTVNFYPKSGTSISAAAVGRHRIGYADIFEKGGTIAGKHGLLWIPFTSTPKGRGGSRPTPKSMSQDGVKLFSLNRPGKRPLLAANIRVPAAQAGAGVVKATMGKLRAGTSGNRGSVRAVPLFFGVDSVQIQARFNTQKIADEERANLPGYYVEAFDNLEGA